VKGFQSAGVVRRRLPEALVAYELYWEKAVDRVAEPPGYFDEDGDYYEYGVDDET
jgi:hypothetical protein